MKVFCENCGRELEAADVSSGNSGKCGACGCEFTVQQEGTANAAIKAVAGMAGMAPIQGFSWKRLFSEVFRAHTQEEKDRFWSYGSVGNIPSINHVCTDWPTPWMFTRLFLISIVAFLLLYLGWTTWDNTNFLPGMMFIGNFAIPLSLLVFFYEMNLRRNVSLYLVLKIFLIGGILSLLTSMVFFRFTSYAGLDWMGASVAGIAEESGKLLAVLLFVQLVRFPYIHNGLLFGAAVGAGFAAFESAGYTLKFFLLEYLKLALEHSGEIMKLVGNTQNVYEVLSGVTSELANGGVSEMLCVMSIRAMLTCLTGHILWTGMSAAALWRVKGSKPFSMSMLCDFRFLRIFLIAVISHMIWNLDWELQLVTQFDKYILLGIINWIVIFTIIHSGIIQLKREKEQYAVTPEKEPAVSEVIREQIVYIQKMVEPNVQPRTETRTQQYGRTIFSDEAARLNEREMNREDPLNRSEQQTRVRTTPASDAKSKTETHTPQYGHTIFSDEADRLNRIEEERKDPIQNLSERRWKQYYRKDK